MNFQEKLLEASSQLRARTADRLDSLQASLEVLNGAGRELGKVARRHATRFVQRNSSIASAAGKDVSKLARSTYDSLSMRQAPDKRRRATASRRRARKAA
jgi:hypothetical protein